MSSWIVPPEAQGQTVEVSYRWEEGFLFKRVHDASDQSETVYRMKSFLSDEIPEGWHPVNGHPPVPEGGWVEVTS